MKKVGILGGTFDPPHYGHLIIANEALQHLQLDEIKFMPNQEPPHKERLSGATAEQRIQMLNLAISNNDVFSVETIEMEREGRSFTFDTIQLLQAKHPDLQFYFIIGADMVEYLPNWHRIDELVKMVQFVGVNRPSYRTESDYPIQHLEVPQIEISSSMIRERIKMGRTVRYLLPESVIEYIKEYQLYGS